MGWTSLDETRLVGVESGPSLPHSPRELSPSCPRCFFPHVCAESVSFGPMPRLCIQVEHTGDEIVKACSDSGVTGLEQG